MIVFMSLITLMIVVNAWWNLTPIDWSRYSNERIKGIFILIFLFLGLVGFFVFPFVYQYDDTTQLVVTSEAPIYSVVDNTSVSGGFFLGCGYTGSDLNYYYITKDEFGENVNKVSATSTSIKTIDGDPRIVQYEYQHTKKGQGWFVIRAWFPLKKRTVLEVPEDTIKYDYNIDLQ